MPQPDSTSVDQPQVVEEIVKETIESDEEFSDSINLEKCFKFIISFKIYKIAVMINYY